MMRNYRGSRVVIIGLGMTGLSCVNFFLSKGVIPKVIDTRTYTSNIHKLPNIVQFHLGEEMHDKWIFNATLIVVSPGISLDNTILAEALKLGIEIVGDIELFVREVTAPIIAITGSNGKSTVTQLVTNMARNAGWNVGVAGNIGIPALTLLNKPYQLYVLEISSFQLDTTYSLRAFAATILNISIDHLDRYPDGFKQYCMSKQKIYQNAKFCIVNSVDFFTRPIFHNYDYQISFGCESDYQLEYYKGNFWIVAYSEFLINCSKLKIHGRINYINALSALALVDTVKIPRVASLGALRKFPGLPYRNQLVYKNHGVCWINDSKATNVAAAKETINSLILSEKIGTLHLLLGGYGKGADFNSLKCLIKKNEIHIYCFGQDGLLMTELGYNNVILTDNMMQAMCIVSRCVKRGDIVLLSPACSSLDQFTSFKERGFLFSYLARKFG